MLPLPDVNECELLSGVCGEAFCENVEGSFLCVCADENQEYSPMTGQCRSRASAGKSLCHVEGMQGSPRGSAYTQVWARHSRSEVRNNQMFWHHAVSGSFCALSELALSVELGCE